MKIKKRGKRGPEGKYTAGLSRRCKKCQRHHGTIRLTKCPYCGAPTVFVLSYRDTLGRHIKVLGEISTAKAREIRDEKQKEMDEILGHRDMRVGEFFRWLKGTPIVDDPALQDRQWVLHKFLTGIDQSIMIRNLTHDEIEKAVSSPNASPRSVMLYVQYLSKLFDAGIKQGVIGHNPAKGFKACPAPPPRRVYITREKFNQVLSSLPEKYRDPALIGYLMPMRRDEIFGLRWEEVNLIDGCIELPAHRVKKTWANRGMMGRTVPLHPEATQTLDRRSRAVFATTGDILSGEVFVDVPKRGFDSAWDTAREEAGLPDLHFHDLRHCAITNMRRAGNDITVIMEAAGHESLQSFSLYNEITKDELLRIKWEGKK